VERLFAKKQSRKLQGHFRTPNRVVRPVLKKGGVFLVIMAKRENSDLAYLNRRYLTLRDEVVSLLEQARRSSARAVNSVMTAAYWQVGRRIGRRNLLQMRSFYLAFPKKVQTPSALSPPGFPLPWSHYVKWLTVQSPSARDFYQADAKVAFS